MKNQYQSAKMVLKEIAINAKRNHKNDKPQIRQIINDSAYYLGSDLSEYQKTLLSNYACKLHPNN